MMETFLNRNVQSSVFVLCWFFYDSHKNFLRWCNNYSILVRNFFFWFFRKILKNKNQRFFGDTKMKVSLKKHWKMSKRSIKKSWSTDRVIKNLTTKNFFANSLTTVIGNVRQNLMKLFFLNIFCVDHLANI